MATKSKWAAFKSGGKVPASVIGADKDMAVEPGKPVKLPADYVDHLVADGFAVEVDAPKTGGKAKGEGDKAKAEELAAEQLKAAQEAVATAQLALDGLEEGADGYAEAADALAVAQAELAVLEAQAS